jgi:transposase
VETLWVVHALLTHEGWPCARGRLLTADGRRWLDGLRLDPTVRMQVDVMLSVISSLQEQQELLERDLRRFARADRRCQALQTIFGVGPILACHLLAEIGDVRRFRRARQLVRASGFDPTVIESADSKRRGRLAKQGSRHLRWALVEAANHSHRCTSPDHALYASTVSRCGRGRARLTVARKIARRTYHVLLTDAA